MLSFYVEKGVCGMVCIMRWIATFFASIGAINWALHIFFGVNLVEYLCRVLGKPQLNKLFYAIIGLFGLYALISLFR
jgi:uncharacterized membrane protein YuzA (DUF378 family)